MTARLLDGEARAARMRAEMAERVAQLVAAGIRPGLGTILVGDDAPSERYVALKHQDCAAVGMASVGTSTSPKETSQRELEAVIARFNADPSVHAYLVQLPLPTGLDEEAALLAVGRHSSGRRRPAPREPRAWLVMRASPARCRARRPGSSSCCTPTTCPARDAKW